MSLDQFYSPTFSTEKHLKSKYHFQLPKRIQQYRFGIRISKDLTSKGQHQLQGSMFVPVCGMAVTDSSAVREIKFLEQTWDGKVSAKGTHAETHYLLGAETNSPLSCALGSSLSLQHTIHHVRTTFAFHLASVTKEKRFFYSPCLVFFHILFSSLTLAAKHKQDSINQKVLIDLSKGSFFTVQMEYFLPIIHSFRL